MMQDKEILKFVQEYISHFDQSMEMMGMDGEIIAKTCMRVEQMVKLYKSVIPGVIREDLQAYLERDPAATSDAEVLKLYSGLHALEMHRLAYLMHNNGARMEARALSQLAKFLTGVEIHPGAKIGKGLVIDHGAAVVIGETTEIGDNCTLYQGVTLGGTGKDVGKRHPTLGNGVLVGSGAKILGPFKVGDYSKIAAGAVVLKEVPPHSTAVGIPAKIVKTKNNENPSELDQIHTPDPVQAAIQRLEKRIEELENELAELKK